MTNLAELIERLEKATEPTRGLADDVLFACGWQTNYSAEEIEEVRRYGWKCEAENGEEFTDTFAAFMDCACWYPPGEVPFRGKWIHGHYRPNPLASLEAALTLVPEGWTWTASNRAPEPHTGRGYVHNGELHMSGRYRGFECTAATPALALCIASLKARQS